MRIVDLQLEVDHEAYEDHEDHEDPFGVYDQGDDLHGIQTQWFRPLPLSLMHNRQPAFFNNQRHVSFLDYCALVHVDLATPLRLIFFAFFLSFAAIFLRELFHTCDISTRSLCLSKATAHQSSSHNI